MVEALLLAAVVEHGANFKLISLRKREMKTLMVIALRHCCRVSKHCAFKDESRFRYFLWAKTIPGYKCPGKELSLQYMKLRHKPLVQNI